MSFQPWFIDCEDYPGSFRWRIRNPDNPECHYGSDFGNWGFASKIDCEIAIATLISHGVTNDTDVQSLPGNEFERLCCINLRW